MKNFFLYLLIVVLLSNCQKEAINNNNNTACQLEQTNFYNGATLTNSIKYGYDNVGRIRTITDADLQATTTYSYFPDSVVGLSSKYKQVYFLKNGLADSSIMIWFNPPQNFKYLYKYQYNTEGYLVSERQIFSQVSNGITISDTVFLTYTISNGNLVKVVQSPRQDEIRFEYSTDARPLNNHDLPNSSKFSFLGKGSKNLPDKTLVNGVLVSTMTYEYNNKGNISKFIATNAGPGPTYSSQYVYTCD